MKTTMTMPGASRGWLSARAVTLTALLLASSSGALAAALTVTVTAPTGKEEWAAGTSQLVSWTVAGSTANVGYYKVALSTDGGITWPAAGTANDLTPNGILDPNARSFSWTIGSSMTASQARIRVRALAADSTMLAEDASTANFAIGAAALTVSVTAPTGKEDWTVGTTQSVTWSVTGSTAGVGYYKVALSTDGGITWPAAGTLNDLTPNGILDAHARSFSWTIGSSMTTEKARIRVRALAADSTTLAENVTDANFTIGGPLAAPRRP